MESLEGRWGLEFNPFEGVEARRLHVSVPPQTRACLDLRGAIARAERLVRVIGPAGVGKSTVIGRLLAEHRGPHCRVARIAGAFDTAELYGRLADALRRERVGSTRDDAATAWRRLVDAVRLCRVQELSVVLAVDDVESLDTSALERLAQLDRAGGLDVTVLVASVALTSNADDTPVILIQPLTRTEAWDYLAAKTEAAGGPRGFWSREAATRLHALARGLPRALDRLAGQALREALHTGDLVIEDDTRHAALPYAVA